MSSLPRRLHWGNDSGTPRGTWEETLAAGGGVRTTGVQPPRPQAGAHLPGPRRAGRAAPLSAPRSAWPRAPHTPLEGAPHARPHTPPCAPRLLPAAPRRASWTPGAVHGARERRLDRPRSRPWLRPEMPPGPARGGGSGSDSPGSAASPRPAPGPPPIWGQGRGLAGAGPPGRRACGLAPQRGAADGVWGGGGVAAEGPARGRGPFPGGGQLSMLPSSSSVLGEPPLSSPGSGWLGEGCLPPARPSSRCRVLTLGGKAGSYHRG